MNNFTNTGFNHYSNKSIIGGIKESFKNGNYLTKLIYINIAVFLVVKIMAVLNFFGLNTDIVPYLELPAYYTNLLNRPWTVVTHMFLHEGFLHILFNILWLYWFGRIFLMFLDHKKLLSVYILGGLFGAGLYILAYNFLDVFQAKLLGAVALGASGSVMAIGIAMAAYKPNYQLRLLFVGGIRLKYLALILIVLDVIMIPGTNPGGHIAHLGGALFGIIFGLNIRKGKNLAKGTETIMESFFRLFKRSKVRVSYKKDTKDMSDWAYNKQKKENKEVVNKILDKISKSGYDSLSKKEKEILFKSSKDFN